MSEYEHNPNYRYLLEWVIIHRPSDENLLPTVVNRGEDFARGSSQLRDELIRNHIPEQYHLDQIDIIIRPFGNQ